MQSENKNQSVVTMKTLGYAGLIPFILLLLISMLGNESLSDKGAEFMLFYAAMILTFLGAVHWGIVLQSANSTIADSKRLWWAVTPSLIGWVALMLSEPLGITLLMFAFVLCWWVDKAFYKQYTLAWYMNMRTHLTVVVVASLGALLLVT